MFTGAKMLNTALQRQNRRLERLRGQGIARSTVFVHEDCKTALNKLRPHLIDPVKASELSGLLFELEEKKSPTNVASVRQLSPFRYPGGKTWLVPEIKKWVLSSTTEPKFFIEPFAGGAMAGLTVAAENLARDVVLCELDADVAAVWKLIFHGSVKDVDWLCKEIITFEVSLGNVQKVLSNNSQNNKNQAFRTIIKNRMQRGGILAAGAGLVKSGEAGRGLNSRWYPQTLVNRIKALRALVGKIEFVEGDAFDLIEQYAKEKGAFFFVDPPYTAGGKKAGKRLYTHSEIDHDKLFRVMSKVRGKVMLTYDDAPEVRELANRYGFSCSTIPMKNTHHKIMNELIILNH